MIEKIKKELGRPASWAYFILVVALLYIVSDNSKSIKGLQADLDNAITEISTLEALNETTLEAMANEVAVRDDAIAGLNNAIAGWESDSVAVNARLNDSDTLRGELEVQIADLTARLNASASALDESASALETSIFALNDAKWRLDDAIANPNCPVQ